MKKYEENVMEYIKNSVISSFIWLIVCTVVCVVSFQFVDSTNTDTATISMVVAFFSLLFAIWSVVSCKYYSVRFKHPKKIKIYNTKVLGIEINFDSATYYLIVKGEKPNKVMRVFISQEDKDKYKKDDVVVVSKYKQLTLLEDDIEKYTGNKFTRVDCK